MKNEFYALKISRWNSFPLRNLLCFLKLAIFFLFNTYYTISMKCSFYSAKCEILSWGKFMLEKINIQILPSTVKAVLSISQLLLGYVLVTNDLQINTFFF